MRDSGRKAPPQSQVSRGAAGRQFEMRRTSRRCAELNICPMCKKVVEYGVMCVCCASWFHATEQCCAGGGLADAFLRAGQSWCCLNCSPEHGKPQELDPLKHPAAAIELLDWRRALRVLTDACSGCGLKVPKDLKALRCADCEVVFHPTPSCTGQAAAVLATHQLLTAPELLDVGASKGPTAGSGTDGHALDAGVSGESAAAVTVGGEERWSCPTCLVRKTGVAVKGGFKQDDVTEAQEDVRIPLINEVDDELLPTELEYCKQVLWRHPNAVKRKAELPLADWCGECIANDACSYRPATNESNGKPVWRPEGGGAAYNEDGCLFFARDVIFECNDSSSCGPSCHNRVVGRGITKRLQVFKTIGRGWGVRSLEALRAGSFVCEYTGEMLLDNDAEASGLAVDDSYLFNLDGEEKGKVSKRRRTSEKADQRLVAAAQIDENPALCVDASRTGSVARYLNHCCEPNVFVQSVFVDYARDVHRIGLFAARDILPYEELVYDYGYVVGSVQGKTLKCLCGAASCRGYLF